MFVRSHSGARENASKIAGPGSRRLQYDWLPSAPEMYHSQYLRSSLFLSTKKQNREPLEIG